MDLWLDDMRPAPKGWHHVKTVEEAKFALLTASVQRASLDHDLGACTDCLKGRLPSEWLDDHDGEQMPNCEHFGTGFTLVRWMEETGNWPTEKPTVHSANRAGSAMMRAIIDKHYD